MMTGKERFEAALRQQPVDRLPFWVKIFGNAYLQHQPEPYRSMSELELVDHLELDHMASGPAPVVGRNDRVTRRVSEKEGRRTVLLETPDGRLRSVEGYAPASGSWHPLEFPIKTPDDLKAARHLFATTRYEVRSELRQRGEEKLAAVGERGITTTGMGISPLMDLLQHLCGVQGTYLMLEDHPAEMEELIQLMHEDRLRFLDAMLPACPYEWVVCVENTSTTLLSPAVFERYCWKHLQDYGQAIRRHGKQQILHQCGHLKRLLPRIAELPAIAIEAYTTPPVGNTTLADRGRLCPNLAVIGGTNAALWLRSAEAICREVESDLEAAGSIRGIVLTSAGVLPPSAGLEKVKQVRDWARSITR